MSLSEGMKAPLFTLPGSADSMISLEKQLGRITVLYFYPKDDTPGCTTQGKDFSALKDAFNSIDADIIGVSKDTVAKHDKFIAKHDLTVSLVSDEDGGMINDYSVWVEKNMYGRKYMGIERATFLIDKTGKIAKIWRKVKVKGHAEQVLEAAKTL